MLGEVVAVGHVAGHVVGNVVGNVVVGCVVVLVLLFCPRFFVKYPECFSVVTGCFLHV